MHELSGTLLAHVELNFVTETGAGRLTVDYAGYRAGVLGLAADSPCEQGVECRASRP